MEQCLLYFDDVSGDGEALLLHLILKCKESGLVVTLRKHDNSNRTVTSPSHQGLLLKDSGVHKALLLPKVDCGCGCVSPPPPP